MAFSTLIFVFTFLVLHFAALIMAPTIKHKNIVLLISSLIFYAWGGLSYLLLLVGMVFVNYVGALVVSLFKTKYKRRFWLWVTCAIDLLFLGIFKYTGFFLGNLQFLFGIPESIPQIVLPIGISFYTFQLLTYVVDVYRDEVPPQKSYWLLLLYTSSFHQCIAGPIVRYKDVNEELLHRTFKATEVSEGIMRFTIGLGKKAILANTCAELADSLMPMDIEKLSHISSVGLLLGGACYMLQIYLDFSAYSDMAIGLGLISGFHYKENFNYPYTATSVTDFWRRWHMSLSSFFRDYVYIPLGGSRVKKNRHLLNLFVVWFLTGMWHGASWNYILWGLYFFCFLVLEKYGFKFDIKAKLPFWKRFVRRLYLLAVVYFGWLLFRFTDLGALWTVLKGFVCANGNQLIDSSVTIAFKNHIFFLIFTLIACTPLYKTCVDKLKQANFSPAVSIYNGWIIVAPIVLIFLSLISLVGNSYNPFLYFQF